jgi:hypothetical protein
LRGPAEKGKKANASRRRGGDDVDDDDDDDDDVDDDDDDEDDEDDNEDDNDEESSHRNGSNLIGFGQHRSFLWTRSACTTRLEPTGTCTVRVLRVFFRRTPPPSPPPPPLPPPSPPPFLMWRFTVGFCAVADAASGVCADDAASGFCDVCGVDRYLSPL